VHTLLLRPDDADGVIEVLDEFFPDVRPPRCVSKIGVDRPGLLVSIAMVEIMSHCVALPWGMETGSFAAAGGCGSCRAGAVCGICGAARGWRVHARRGCRRS